MDVANRLDPDQAQQNVWPDLNSAFDFWIVFLKFVNFEKSFVIFSTAAKLCNSVDPDQAQQNIWPIWIRTVWHSDGKSENF